MNGKVCKGCNLTLPVEKFELLPLGHRRGKCFNCKNGRPPTVAPPIQKSRFFRKLTGKRFLITAAQNNTEVHEAFFRTLLVAAEHLDAELIVVPYRYKNPTGMRPGRDLRRDNLCGKKVRG